MSSVESTKTNLMSFLVLISALTMGTVGFIAGRNYEGRKQICVKVRQLEVALNKPIAGAKEYCDGY